MDDNFRKESCLAEEGKNTGLSVARAGKPNISYSNLWSAKNQHFSGSRNKIS